MLDNKYSKWYNSIIQNAQARVLEDSVYTENHHILPKKLNGNNSKENLVKVTGREHFLLHMLLPKFTEGEERYKMLCAAIFMAHGNQKQYTKVTSRQYQSLRQQISKERIGRFAGSKNPWYGKKHSAEAKKKLSEYSKARIGPKNSFYGKHHTEENKKRHSLLMTGTKQTEETQNKKRKSHQRFLYKIIFPDGKEEIVNSIRQFCKIYNFEYSRMTRLAQGKIKNNRGFKIEILEIKNKEKQFSSDWKNKISENKCKYLYEVTYPDNKKEIIKNLSKFCQNHNLCTGTFYSVLSGNRKHHKGFIVKKIGEIKHD